MQGDVWALGDYQKFLPKPHFIQQKIKQIHNKNPVLISVCWLHSARNHDFLKAVFYVRQRTQLLLLFFFGIKSKCRLHINSVIDLVADKIHFQIFALTLALCVFCVERYPSYKGR